VRIFKNAWFVRFAHDQKISDGSIREAVRRAENGQIDANLGGCLIKQRVARPGKGKSRGYRAILLYRAGERAFFVYGFAKSDRDNLDEDEEKQFKKMARYILSLSDEQLNGLIAGGKLEEIESDDEEISK
jgi:hypothetical protein